MIKLMFISGNFIFEINEEFYGGHSEPPTLIRTSRFNISIVSDTSFMEPPACDANLQVRKEY